MRGTLLAAVVIVGCICLIITAPVWIIVFLYLASLLGIR